MAVARLDLDGYIPDDSGRDLPTEAREAGPEKTAVPGPEAGQEVGKEPGPEAGPEAQADTLACPSSKPYSTGSICVACRDDGDCEGRPCILGECRELARDDAAVDQRPDMQTTPDLQMHPEAGPEAKPDTGTDTIVTCPSCADPSWACGSCIDDRLSTYPWAVIFVQCVSGGAYDCHGKALPDDSLCPTKTGPGANMQGCARCNDAPGLRCPDALPYCNTQTGECSAAPAK
jgi:hypothetical protein